jgi:hypothetical protein
MTWVAREYAPRLTAMRWAVCCARYSRSTRRSREQLARPVPEWCLWESCAFMPSSWAPFCAAPRATRSWSGSAARRGGSGSTCGARQPSRQCPRNHGSQSRHRLRAGPGCHHPRYHGHALRGDHVEERPCRADQLCQLPYSARGRGTGYGGPHRMQFRAEWAKPAHPLSDRQH